jgi:hypothetical protein
MATSEVDALRLQVRALLDRIEIVTFERDELRRQIDGEATSLHSVLGCTMTEARLLRFLRHGRRYSLRDVTHHVFGDECLPGNVSVHLAHLKRFPWFKREGMRRNQSSVQLAPETCAHIETAMAEDLKLRAVQIRAKAIYSVCP